MGAKQTSPRAALAGRRSLPNISSSILAIVCCAGCSESLEIAPVEPQEAYVGELLSIPLVISGAKGYPITFTFASPTVPYFTRVAAVVDREDGGAFEWTPLAQHVGAHRIDIIAAAHEESASAVIEVEVLLGRRGAPSLRKMPTGTLFDPSAESCITWPITAEDRDSESIEYSFFSGVPRGATITRIDALSAALRWCPTQDQKAAANRWTITVAATDGEHQQVLLDQVIAFLSPDKSGCPTTPPEVIWITPEHRAEVHSEVGYEAELTVNANALRTHPLVLHSVARFPEGAQVDPTPFPFVVTEPSNNQFVAWVPTRRFGEDEAHTLTLVSIGSDNADPNGTRCDRALPQRRRQFLAHGAAEAGILQECMPCSESGDCRSGICATDPAGGRCVPACNEATPCPVGTCMELVSGDGPVRWACGDVRAVCQGGRPCEEDAGEEDDTMESARAITGSTDQICHRDHDVLALPAPQADSTVTITFDTQDALELHWVDETGRILGVTNASLTRCIKGGARTFVRVFSPTQGRGTYRVEHTASAGSCRCVEDPFEDEERDGIFAALNPPRTGNLCPGDSDRFTLAGVHGERFVITATASDADLDLELRDEDGRVVAAATSTSGREQLTFDPDEVTYQLEVFARDFGTTTYALSLTRAPLDACSDHCPSGHVCERGRCRRVVCRTGSDCATDQLCPGRTRGTRDTCSPPCTSDASCASGEVCKRFNLGNACGYPGTLPLGAACTTASQCRGALSCVDWPNGYCSAYDCTADPAVCGAGHCVYTGARMMCATDCWQSDTQCRLTEGYRCAETFDHREQLQMTCIPQP